MLFVFNFSTIFYHINRLLIIPNFLKIDKVIVRNCYQNLDDELTRECVRLKINILRILDVAKRLYLKNSKKHIDIQRKYKEEMEGVHYNATAFMHQNIKTSS